MSFFTNPFIIAGMQPSQTPPICDYEGSDYQASFWGQGERAYEDQVEAIALKRLLPAYGRLLLEIGAGAGRNTPRYTGFERIVLLDYSRTQLLQAKQRLSQGDRLIYVAADAYHLPFVPNIFDAATMIRTLHHMADAPRALAQVRRVLEPGGTFILEFASKHNFKAILRYLLRRQSWSPFSLEPVEFAALNFDFHPAAVRHWLRENGFEIERQLTVSHYRISLLKRLVPLRLLVWMDSLAQLTGDLWQLTPSVFLRAKAIGQVTDQAKSGQAVELGRIRTPHPGRLLNGEEARSIPPPAVLFCCPVCGHSPLEEIPQALVCPNCSRSWEIQDGIYNFKSDFLNHPEM